MPFVFTLDGKVVRQEPSRRVTRGTQTREVRCREPLKYYMVPITPRLYTVAHQVPRNTVADLEIYWSLEDWHTSLFYINSLGVNYWITLARCLNKLKKWNRDKKAGKQEGYARIPDQKQPSGWRTNINQGEYFSLTFCQMCAYKQRGILTVNPVTPWVYKTEVLSFYEERTQLFWDNQNVRYWSYYYIHSQTGEQYQITL